MNRLLLLTALSLALGYQETNHMAQKTNPPEAGVQLFNEQVLGSSSTDAIPLLLSSADSAWSPRQVAVDYRDGACYGAMVHYDRSKPFETLRTAINARFREHEQPFFADDSTMGIWRMDAAGFTIQLSDDEEEDSYLVIYLLFVEPATMATELQKLHETEPEMFDGVYSQALQKPESTDAMPPGDD